MNSIFGPGSDMERRIVDSYENLEEIIRACKALGKKIVLLSGTFDLLHIGHCRFFEEAKKAVGADLHNVVLVVGVDSDEKVKERKGPNRPVVPVQERAEMLCHIRHVDLVKVKEATDEHWGLIKVVAPDVLIVSKRIGLSQDELDTLGDMCGEVIELESQAMTSTSAKIRMLIVEVANQIREKLEHANEQISVVIQGVIESLEDIMGGGK